jgi:non-specific serine/threonine protein kinase/serine/threonine-protein kinase
MSHESPERWRRISSLFDEAVKLPAVERAAFLEKACGEDAELRARVLELLASSDRAPEFLEKPLLSDAGPLLRQAADLVDSDSCPPATDDPEAATTRSRATSLNSSETIGPYRLLQKIGEGGMGEVWLAKQTEPIHRQVGLKVIKAGLDTKQVVARFEAERQALAMMDHPSIAKVFDAGATSRGLPYFAMEYVKGEPITTYCDRLRLGTPERLELFARVCEAVQHAHQKGVIHRDLKPTNVLVGIVGDHPQPKVIDFGVAKATAQRLTEKTMFTELGMLIGTPEYMSPEQAEMTGLDVDTRTDVYALGVMLYELLTGALPFESKELRKAGFEEIRRRIREVDPPKPSTKVRTQGEHSTEAAKNRQTDPGKLASRLQGDLDWIVMKALEKDRTRRYGTPSELSADLQRHLKHEPVLAGPPSAAYRFRKFVRRHRFGVAAASLAVLGLAAFGVVMTIQARAIARERDRAERVSGFLVELFKVSDPSEARGNSITAREVLDRGAVRIDKELGGEPLVQAQMMDTMGRVYTNLGLYPKAVELLRPAMEIRERLLGQEDACTLQSMHTLGWALRREGHNVEAETVVARTLALRRRVLGSDHPDTLNSLNDLAVIYQNEGKREAAGKIFLEVLQTRRRVQDKNHRDLIMSIHNLGFDLLQQGRFPEGEKYLREAVEAFTRTLGHDHPDTLWAKRNLAQALTAQGRFQDAETLHREVLDTQRRVLGPEHTDVLSTVSMLAETVASQGRYDEAESLFKDTLEKQRRLLGPDHLATLMTMQRLSLSVYQNAGRYTDAQKVLGEVYEVARTQRGEKNPASFDAAYGLACLYALEKNRATALAWLRKSVEGGFSDFGWMAKDPDLQYLHGDSEFEQLVALAQTNAVKPAKKDP